MPVSKARKRSKTSGQRADAGRFAFARSLPGSQAIALRWAGRVILIAAACVLASSTLTDPLQKLSDEAVRFTTVNAAGAVSKARQQERLALLRRTAQNTDGVRGLSPEELTLLFGSPSLKREEPEVESWHFTSADCALDVYFPRKANGLARHPVYAEYRVRDDADGETLRAGTQKLDHRTCVKSLFTVARFADNS